ncbi:Ribosomal RNA small subunit methyltransferase E [Leucobacter sp. 7(1)]|uniref:16S rRNA (uracil(1498)-N(3))-methyltransferase n=1 Tax=Leucobacter sp. 7(1) TaxID=1255613 RepID=UPI00097F69E8|nr:16S rRNA (uracil(1498)-N(3))-methyltransferase [Leucobacter sp. 7(1)]SJN12445.1 Ribosomal RNA small subunit methyltransferase E [Leucobacter sp. 7(1)]
MANLYYREDLEAAAFVPGAEIEVDGDEAHHAVRVSRLRVGEQILLGNGSGALARGTVTVAEKQRFAVALSAVQLVEAATPRVVLAQALAKGDRDERAVEQATEFGIDAILPWEATRSVSRWADADKRERGRAKWQRIAREAAKQSVRPWIPEIESAVTLSDLAERCSAQGTAVVALHPAGTTTLSAWASDHAAALTEIILVIGPEGGFADAELDTLRAAGADVRVLGETVLRTSSAGPAGIAVLNTILGRW